MPGELVGAMVPVVMLPRFTSYVGPGSYSTAPMDVTAFDYGEVTFWRGPLVGGATTDPFLAYLEESHDTLTWTAATPSLPITAVNTFTRQVLTLTKRWFRVRVVLDDDANGVVALTMWMAGALQARTSGGA